MGRSTALNLVLVVLWAVPGLVSASAADAKPNVVLIVADDLGYRELGSFGQKLIQTPNLDELAKQGMRLTQHYSGNAVCAPSRCVLMTGKHPGHAYVRSNRSTPPEGQQPIPDMEVTLSELMKAQGYATGAYCRPGWPVPSSGSVVLMLFQGFVRNAPVEEARSISWFLCLDKKRE